MTARESVALLRRKPALSAKGRNESGVAPMGRCEPQRRRGRREQGRAAGTGGRSESVDGGRDRSGHRSPSRPWTWVSGGIVRAGPLLGVRGNGPSHSSGRSGSTCCYKGTRIGEARLDLVVDGRLLVELNATEGYSSTHLAQVLSYLKATRLTLGLRINVNVPSLGHGLRRVVRMPTPQFLRVLVSAASSQTFDAVVVV